ncbi:RNA 2'-phosphotransferase [Variovorax ureilyticus]|uniref:RNA 2'-phosphotransferase n=1 Tax=Variovorax ureilyticus TaxID=1836198 RepID=UPI003D67F918
MREELVPLSRLVARVLRHKPEIWGLRLDSAGWCSVADLLAAATKHGVPMSLQILEEIVFTNDRVRFTFSKGGRQIRAAQGHSVEVDLNLQTTVPPPVLYHGTVRKSVASILREGLLPMRGHAVHLSASPETARAVGARRRTPVILVINSYAMNRDGHKFQLTDNGVWLVAAVPTKYLSTDR